MISNILSSFDMFETRTPWIFYGRIIASILLMAPFMLPYSYLAMASPLDSLQQSVAHGMRNYSHTIVGVTWLILAIWTFIIRDRKNALPLFIALVVYLSSLTISIGSSANNPSLQHECSYMLLCIVTGLSVALVCGTAETIVVALIITTTLSAALGLLGFVRADFVLTSGSLHRASGNYENPNLLALVVASGLPLVSAALVRARTGTIQFACCIAIAILSAALILTWSRWVILGLTFASVAVILRNFRVNQLLKILTVFGVAVLLSLVLLMRDYNQASITSTQRSNIGHWQLLRNGLSVASAAMPFGVGIGAMEVPVKVKIKGVIVQVNYPRPDSLLVLWLGELGIGGGLLFFLYCFGIYQALISRDQSDSLGLALKTVWLSLGVSSIIMTPFGFAAWSQCNVIVTVLLGATLLYVPVEVSSQTKASARKSSANSPDNASESVFLLHP